MSEFTNFCTLSLYKLLILYSFKSVVCITYWIPAGWYVLVPCLFLHCRCCWFCSNVNLWARFICVHFCFGCTIWTKYTTFSFTVAIVMHFMILEGPYYHVSRKTCFKCCFKWYMYSPLLYSRYMENKIQNCFHNLIFVTKLTKKNCLSLFWLEQCSFALSYTDSPTPSTIQN